MKTSLLVFVTLAAAFTSAAQANVPSRDPYHRVVKYYDLDLTRSADAQKLHARIRSAAREVCKPKGTMADVYVARTRECIRTSIAKAVADVNAPALSQLQK